MNGGEIYYEFVEWLLEGVEKIIVENLSGNIFVVFYGMLFMLLLYLL